MADYSEFLTCAICLEIYNDPYALTCLHSFCKKCLETLNSKDRLRNCPLCRQDLEFSTIQPDFRIKEFIQLLQTNKLPSSSSSNICNQCEDELCSSNVNFCKDCDFIICMDCSILHKKKRKTKDHSVYSLTHEKLLFCEDHDKKYEYFCQESSCQTLLCVSCALLDHINHKKQTLKEQKLLISQEILKNAEIAKQNEFEINLLTYQSNTYWKSVQEKCNDFEVSARKRRDLIIEKANEAYDNAIASMCEIKNDLKNKYNDNKNKMSLLREQQANLMTHSEESLMKKTYFNLKDLNENFGYNFENEYNSISKSIIYELNRTISVETDEKGIEEAIIDYIGKVTEDVDYENLSNNGMINPQVVTRCDIPHSKCSMLDIVCDEQTDTAFVLSHTNNDVLLQLISNYKIIKDITIAKAPIFLYGSLAMLENRDVLIRLPKRMFSINVDENLSISKNGFHLNFCDRKDVDIICGSPCRKFVYFHSRERCIYKYCVKTKEHERADIGGSYLYMSVSQNLDYIALSNLSKTIDLFSFSKKMMLRSFENFEYFGISFLTENILIACRRDSFTIVNVENGDLIIEFEIFDNLRGNDEHISSFVVSKCTPSMFVVARRDSIYKVKLF